MAQTQKRYCESGCWLESYSLTDQSVTPDTDFEPYVPRAVHGVHTPINEWQIRILCVEPGNRNDDVVTTLEPAHLSIYEKCAVREKSEDQVKYHALSYSWGYHGETAAIECNGIRFLVLKGLEVAIRFLRKADEPIYLWIDVICIDQSNVDEKAIQIQRIFTIYHRAQSVKVWLGTEMECGAGAFRYLTEFDEKFIHRQDCHIGLQAVYVEIAQLANRPWFSRTWVRQEVYAADTVNVIVGGLTVSFAKLRQAITSAREWASNYNKGRVRHHQALNMEGILRLNTQLLSIKQSSVEIASSLVFNRKAIEQQSFKADVCLDTQLRGSRDFNATDHRDFVYGILSMTSATVNIDHRASKLLRSTDQMSLVGRKGDDSLAITCLDPILVAFDSRVNVSNRCMVPSLPSWSPDWRCLPRTVGLDRARQVFETIFERVGDSPAWNNAFGPSALEAARTDEQQWGPVGSGPFAGLSQDLSRRFSCTRVDMQYANGSYKLHTTGFLLGSLGSLAYLTDLSMYPLSSTSDLEDKNAPLLAEEYLRRGVPGYKFFGFQESLELPTPNKPVLRLNKGMMNKRAIMMRKIVSTLDESLSSFRHSWHTWKKCICPDSAREGDLVVLLIACSTPAIIRPMPTQGGQQAEFQLIGPAYSGRHLVREATVEYGFSVEDGAVVSMIEDLSRRSFVLV